MARVPGVAEVQSRLLALGEWQGDCFVYKGKNDRGWWATYRWPVSWKMKPGVVGMHKASYELFCGPVGDLHVLHHCDNPPCFNPRHLFLGTREDNMRDMIEKGRGATQRLSVRAVRSARVRRANGERVTDLANEYGVPVPAMSDALSGRTYGWLA